MNMTAFLIGGVIGFVIRIQNDRREFERYNQWWNDPSTEEFICDENGDKIWSNKRGCIGKSTYVKFNWNKNEK